MKRNALRATSTDAGNGNDGARHSVSGQTATVAELVPAPGELNVILQSLQSMRNGDFSVRAFPVHGQRMLDRWHRSDDALQGLKVLVVDDDVRNIFALSSVLERRGMRVLTAGTGREVIETLESTPDLAIVLMDIMDAGDGRIRNHAGDPSESLIPASADYCADC